MPYVTKFNHALVLKKISGEIVNVDEIFDFYSKEIYFLNKLDKSNLHYFDSFCRKMINNESITIYEEFKSIDTKEFVFEGGKPSYHKYENCIKLHSNFVNLKIPENIKRLGAEAVNEFRLWVKANYELFEKDYEAFKMRYRLQFKNSELLLVNYTNSGFDYVEDYNKEILNSRIDSLLYNAAQYFKQDQDKKNLLTKYQRATFLAFKPEPLDECFNFSDEDAKAILKEYFYMFIEPVKFYLNELIKVKYKGKITSFDFGESLLKSLNFNPCNHCYDEQYTHNNDNFYTKFVAFFGNYPVTKEAGVFNYVDIENTNFKIAFILTRVLRILDGNSQIDGKGNRYFNVFIDYVNEFNQYEYCSGLFYAKNVEEINKFRKYITRVSFNKVTHKMNFQLYLL